MHNICITLHMYIRAYVPYVPYVRVLLLCCIHTIHNLHTWYRYLPSYLLHNVLCATYSIFRMAYIPRYVCTCASVPIPIFLGSYCDFYKMTFPKLPLPESESLPS
ncbi:hypothetical protein GGR53DRAFT_217938 [Hypoxylon sp. FL1150]|nr:hypothetical protein GGR53DRAFT_217938 [Hypoxylon sp. FL1150]